MPTLAEINCKFCDLLKRIKRLESQGAGSNGGIDTYINGGSIVGNTLVLNNTQFGSVNIPLDSLFSDLSDIQKQAIRECFVGEGVAGLDGVVVGYLWEL